MKVGPLSLAGPLKRPSRWAGAELVGRRGERWLLSGCNRSLQGHRALLGASGWWRA